MRDRSIIVLGGSVAGFAAALALARDGHSVTVLERDAVTVGAPLDAPAWERRGIPHFLQPHAIIPRGRREIAELFPDVLSALKSVGAEDLCVGHKVPGPPIPEDEDLTYLVVRRPLVEWALRRAITGEHLVRVIDGTMVSGVTIEDGRVTGVRVGDAAMAADVIVDAMGRRSPVAEWLAAAGVPGAAEPPQTSDCGVIYYCRYYRLHPGRTLAEGPWLFSPRGDLGYFAFASFPGDNDTLAKLLAVPNGVPEWRILAQERPFEAAVASIPQLCAWAQPDAVEPITGVMPMAGLRNSLRQPGPMLATGVFPAGDALCHTDPVLAHGLSFALVHARELTKALRDHADDRDAATAYASAVMPALQERYRFSTELDEQRHRLWVGEPVDYAHHDGDYALFSMAAAGAVATVDAEVCRVFARRIGLIDSTAVLDDDLDLRRRIEARFAELLTKPRPPMGPSRDEMLALISNASHDK